MAKKIKAPEALAAPVLPKKVLPKASDADRLARLEDRVSELESDNLRMAELCGKVWGEPLASEALKIVSKRQNRG